jgi:hypothetical protein
MPRSHQLAVHLHADSAFTVEIDAIPLPVAQESAANLHAGGAFEAKAITLPASLANPAPNKTIRRGRPDRTVTVDSSTWAALRPEAVSRGCSVAGLALDLLAVVARDHLVAAVLDSDP